MKRFNFHSFPRDIDSGTLIENFLVSALASILVIRVFLHLTDYPSLIGKDIHIAHMLWGGFLMMAALISLLVFLNKETKYIASIVGGIGFGTFIDELGKFLTKDNNYFYQPTIAFIYVIFVLLFFLARVIEKYFLPSKQEYAINALELTKQILMHDLDVEEKERALYFLKLSDPENPIVKMLSSALQEVKARSLGKPNFFHLLKDFAKQKYLKITQHPRFITVVINFFIIASLINLLNAIFNFKTAQSFSDSGQLIFSILSGSLVIVGVIILRYKNSRKLGYDFFKFAVLISIFLTQFFRFLEEQLSAISGLLVSLIILSVLQYLIYEENLVAKKSDFHLSENSN